MQSSPISGVNIRLGYWLQGPHVITLLAVPIAEHLPESCPDCNLMGCCMRPLLESSQEDIAWKDRVRANHKTSPLGQDALNHARLCLCEFLLTGQSSREGEEPSIFTH